MPGKIGKTLQRLCRGNKKSSRSRSLFDMADLAHPGDRVRRTKMILRLLLYFRHHRKVEAIFNAPLLREIPLANPRIYKKIYRQYLYNGASMAERVRLLEQNYRFVGEFFDPSWITSIYVQRDFTLCDIVLADGEKLSARLEYDERFTMEGELTLGLYDEQGARLYSMSFAFQTSGATRTAVIGCMIGGGCAGEAGGQAAQPTSKRLTKGLHGLRPKNLALFLLQTLCRHLGVTTLLAVGLDSHVYGGRSTRRRDRIKFNYDQFWEEVGGARSQDEKFFALPLDDVRRSSQEMPSNKRALYLRRYALLDGIDAQMRGALTRSAPHGAPEQTHLCARLALEPDELIIAV